jgi:hypothetical protein
MPPQSRQSAKRFSSRWNWDSPTPLVAGECAPPPIGRGGKALSLAAKGVGESQFQRGDIHCGALYIYKYFVYATDETQSTKAKQQRNLRRTRQTKIKVNEGNQDRNKIIISTMR